MVTPSGQFLSSKNTLNSNEARGVLNSGLRRWRSFKANEPKSVPNSSARTESQLPKDGLILREVMRDLPRPVVGKHAWRHNLDYFWLLKEDYLSLVPQDKKEGATRVVEGNFKRKLLQYHLVDSVRGESSPWEESNILDGQIETTITEINDEQIKLSLRGNAKIAQAPSGQRNPFSGKRVNKERGVDMKIAGEMTFNRKSETFDRLDLVAVGERWGTDVYSFRHTDPGPQPIGFAFEILPAESRNRPKPAHTGWGYFSE